jgi:hypothetical protein
MAESLNSANQTIEFTVVYYQNGSLGIGWGGDSKALFCAMFQAPQDNEGIANFEQVLGEILAADPNYPVFLKDPASLASQAQSYTLGPIQALCKQADVNNGLPMNIVLASFNFPSLGSYHDPLVLDLQGTGLQLTSVTNSPVSFDFTGSGTATQTGWITPGEGLLLLNNGSGDLSQEILGAQSGNGFADLQALDSNGDGVINAGITVTVHLILPWLRAALCRSEHAAGGALDRGEEATLPERPADGFGAPQALDHAGFRRFVEKRRKIGEASLNRRPRGNAVVAARELRAHARPAPIPRAADQARPDRIERDVTQRGRQMVLVHRHAAETALPEMPGALAPRMNDAGIFAVNRRQRPAQPIGIGRNQHQMDVIGHQAPRPHLHFRLLAGRRQQIAVPSKITVGEKCSRATIAALGNVMRQAWNDNTGEAGHSA